MEGFHWPVPLLLLERVFIRIVLSEKVFSISNTHVNGPNANWNFFFFFFFYNFNFMLVMCS